MKLEIIKPNKPTSEVEIQNVESKFNIKFPKEFREFLLENNGGKPSELVFKFEDHYIDEPIEMMSFFSLEKIADFLESIQEEGMKDDDPGFMYAKYYHEKILIIGEIYGYLFLCIGHSEDNYGKVYYSDHDHEDDFSIITNSFTEFIEGFEEPEEEG